MGAGRPHPPGRGGVTGSRVRGDIKIFITLIKIFIIRRSGRGRERRGGAGGAAVQRHDAGPEHGPEDGQALHLEVRVGPGASLQTP